MSSQVTGAGTAAAGSARAVPVDGSRIHPAWRAFMEYCRDLQHGDIEKLRIQDGLPVLAELVTRKVKFTR